MANKTQHGVGKRMRSYNHNKTYKDLGVIYKASLNAGSTADTAWFDNVEWVRSLILNINATQNYDLTVVRRDSNGVSDWGSVVSTNNSATGPTTFRPHIVPEGVVGGGGSGLVGASFKIQLKNVSAVTGTYELRCQLFGD